MRSGEPDSKATGQGAGRPMRFLMLNWRDPKNPFAGGAERVTEGYLRALRERGQEVHWFAYAFEGGAPHEDLGGLHIHRAGTKLGAVFAAWKWYRRQPRFDLVIDQHHGLPWFAPWWSGVRTVAYIHEVLGPIWFAFYRGFTARFGQWQERRVIRLYRRVPFWTASQSTRRMLEELGVRRIYLIPYGVHTRPLPELDPKPIGQPLRLAVVSRLQPNKRVDQVLRACRCLLDRGVRLELTIVGAGADEPHLQEETDRLGLRPVVRFTGLLPEAEKDAVLRRAHLLLHTSLREGWGLNVIEANAMGTPAVVYPAPGLTESTLHDETGLVSREETPESLADAVASLLTDDARYQRLRRQAWRRAALYHWDAVLPVACDWLERMAAGEPDPQPRPARPVGPTREPA